MQLRVLRGPSDIVVITPFWSSAAFEYYFHCDNAKVVYPYNTLDGANLYDRVKDRLLDPKLVARFRADLAQACQAGRRVWLVRLCEIPVVPRIPRESNEVPVSCQNLGYIDLAHSRAKQIAEVIESHFGKPISDMCPRSSQEGMEMLKLTLYGERSAQRRTRAEGIATLELRDRGFTSVSSPL